MACGTIYIDSGFIPGSDIRVPQQCPSIEVPNTVPTGSIVPADTFPGGAHILFLESGWSHVELLPKRAFDWSPDHPCSLK